MTTTVSRNWLQPVPFPYFLRNVSYMRHQLFFIISPIDGNFYNNTPTGKIGESYSNPHFQPEYNKMKKIIVLLLAISFILHGCRGQVSTPASKKENKGQVLGPDAAKVKFKYKPQSDITVFITNNSFIGKNTLAIAVNL